MVLADDFRDIVANDFAKAGVCPENFPAGIELDDGEGFIECAQQAGRLRVKQAE
ncbi:hypothetical protein D3C87_2089780 [compost metagenome]